VTGRHGKQFKIMLALVGADFRVTTVERSKTQGGPWYRWRCTCSRQGGDWTRFNLHAYAIGEVHARLWHGAEPERDWRKI
jgi:hypothetical protein